MKWPMEYSRESVPDLKGMVAVVTGANGGLGLQTAKVLAAGGATVITASRDQGKAARADEEIRSAVPGATVEPVELDLADQGSVRRAAEQILARHGSLDILVLNAGLMATPERQTQDGFELQFGVNHLGHWTLTALLMPALLAVPRARVVTVTSTARLLAWPSEPGHPQLLGRYDPWLAYGQSKLANYHFGLGLHERLRRAGVDAMSLLAHPGLSHTDLQPSSVASGTGGPMGRFWMLAAQYAGMEVAAGAMPQIRAATDPGAKSGELYGPRFTTFGPPVRLPVLRPGIHREIDRLWDVSERETGIAITI